MTDSRHSSSRNLSSRNLNSKHSSSSLASLVSKSVSQEKSRRIVSGETSQEREQSGVNTGVVDNTLSNLGFLTSRVIAADNLDLKHISKQQNEENKRLKKKIKRIRTLFMTLGVLLALVIIILQYPSDAWQNPILNYDNPSYFNYIQRLVDEGVGCLFHLAPGDRFYPPLFHFLAFLVVKIGSLFGPVSIAFAISLVWVFESGILWPLGVLLLSKNLAKRAGVTFDSLKAILIPILSVALYCFPYNLLQKGTLYAYSLATCLTPYLILFILKLLDIIFIAFDEEKREKLKPGKVANIISGFIIFFILIMLSQPRVLFTVVLFILPYFVLWCKRLISNYGKRSAPILGVFIGILVIGIAVIAVYVLRHLRSDLLWHPENWFAAHHDLSFAEAAANWFLASLNIIAIVALVIYFIIHSTEKMRLVYVPFAISYIIFTIIYIFGMTFRNGFSNIIAAPWYKDDWRVLAVLPLLVVCLLGSIELKYFNKKINIGTKFIFILIYILVLGGAIFNPQTTKSVNKSDSLTVANKEKVAFFTTIKENTGSQAVILADPFNQSVWEYIYGGRKLVFPIYNSRIDNIPPLKDALDGFASGHSDTMKTMVCENAENSNEMYFVDLGDDLSFKDLGDTYKRFESLHNQDFINTYTKDKAMDLILQQGNYKLYKVNCD
ncbi:MAG: hypothetical protein LBM13_02355 [Candidatus Ancillula sp.]|jgi:hypothetical protein|nr:hypothetical protein [Candidatus Ancillula sp.]